MRQYAVSPRRIVAGLRTRVNRAVGAEQRKGARYVRAEVGRGAH